ncbi:MAG TPA: ACT domain-containing protein [Tepidisphaeraceae bacterium]|jgi:hypothetical protein
MATAMKISKADVWATEMQDQPGALARALEALAGAGASVECVIGRRRADKPGSGVVYLAPVKGKKAEAAARAAGMVPASSIATLRIEGADKAGLGSRIARAIADAGINVRGVSAAVIGNKFVAYIGFDSADDAARAAKAVKSVGSKKK